MIRIINANATSYCTSLIQSLFDDARNEKRSKYGPAAEDRRACFTPILATCEAIFDHEAIVYMKRLATLLASKWSKHYSQIYGWLKARMQVCILCSVSLYEDRELTGEVQVLKMVLRSLLLHLCFKLELSNLLTIFFRSFVLCTVYN